MNKNKPHLVVFIPSTEPRFSVVHVWDINGFCFIGWGLYAVVQFRDRFGGVSKVQVYLGDRMARVF